MTSWGIQDAGIQSTAQAAEVSPWAAPHQVFAATRYTSTACTVTHTDLSKQN